MRRWLVAAALSGVAATGSAQADAIDHYTLIMSWTPGLCWQQPQRAECAGLSLRRYDGRNLAFLALRPDPPEGNMRDEYCFASMGDPDLDRSRRWCDMDDVLIRSKDLKAALDEVMPARQSCQDRGTWAKYGTCSLFSPDEYFSRGVKLAKAMAGTLLNVRIVGAAGQAIKKDELTTYFEMQFGADAAKSLQLVCKGEAGKAHLLEVQIAVTAHALTTGLDQQQLWKPQKPLLGNCPAEIFIDAPPDMVLDPSIGASQVPPPVEPAKPGTPVLPNSSPVVPSPSVTGPTIGGPSGPDVQIGGPKIPGPVVPNTPVPAPGP